MSTKDIDKIYNSLVRIEDDNKKRIASDATQDADIRNTNKSVSDIKTQISDHMKKEEDFWDEIRKSMTKKVDRWLFVWIIGGIVTAGVLFGTVLLSQYNNIDERLSNFERDPIQDGN